MDWIIWTVVIVVVVAVIFGLEQVHEKKMLAKISKEKNKFNPTHTYGDFLVESNTLRWMVATNDCVPKVHHISEVTGWELVENGQRYKSEGGLLRAVVGGALFGGTGAIIGASTAKRVAVVSNLSVNIYMKDLNEPIVVVPCLEHSVSTDSLQYSISCENAQHIIATLQAMQFNYENNPDAYQIPKEFGNPTANLKGNTNKKKEPMEIIVKYILIPILCLCVTFLVVFGILALIHR